MSEHLTKADQYLSKTDSVTVQRFILMASVVAEQHSSHFLLFVGFFHSLNVYCALSSTEQIKVRSNFNDSKI